MSSSDNTPGGAGLPQVGRIPLTAAGQRACRAVLVVVGVLYVVILVVAYNLGSTALLDAHEPAVLAYGLPLGWDFAGTVLVALSLALAAWDSRGQLVTRMYGLALVMTSAGVGAWYGHEIGHGWVNWFVVAHALVATTLFVLAESPAWLLRARIDAALQIERVPLILALFRFGVWRKANIYRLLHRSPVSKTLVYLDDHLKAVDLVLKAAQEAAGYTDNKKDDGAKRDRDAIIEVYTAGRLPVEAVKRAFESGLDKKASRQLLVDAAMAMLSGEVTSALTGPAGFASLLGGGGQVSPRYGAGKSDMALSWDGVGGQVSPGYGSGNDGPVLPPRHGRSDDALAEVLATLDKNWGKSLSIPEAAGALRIGTDRAGRIRKMVPKRKLNGHARH